MQGTNVLVAEDALGIVYHIENSQQFWSELEDAVHIPTDKAPTLSLLDSALKRFISLCASYHEQYLQSPFQVEHACELLLLSELFAFHSERMCEILSDEAQSNTDPHFQLIVYNIFLYYGRRQVKFLRSQKRWQRLIPLLLDHVLVEMDPDVEEMYLGGGSRVSLSFMIPIEAKLRSLGVKLLYEVCRVQKFSVQELQLFSDSFIDHLFDLVEQTRGMQDETFNYSVIKLIVSLNEQFMVAALNPSSSPTLPTIPKTSDSENRVLHVLMRRLGVSKTFGENMIFMLNRANRTAEDLCMQLLILKILYLLFTTKGTSEYFYTNDLCVLVDVFLRELVDLDEDSESLRHTFLRVLHPLLTKTQLRDIPYKRAQIVLALESLVENAEIRDIDPTTRRLVDRCLGGDWCVQYRKVKVVKDVRKGDLGATVEPQRVTSPDLTSGGQAMPGPSASASLERAPSAKKKTLKASKSVENLKAKAKPPRPPRSALDNVRRPSNDSASSLPGVAAATPSAGKRREQPRSGGYEGSFAAQQQGERHHHHHHHRKEEGSHPHRPPVRADSLGTSMDGLTTGHHTHAPPPPSPISLPATSSVVSLVDSSSSPGTLQRRSAPAPPNKRRKPPAVPVASERSNSGATITTIATSNSAPALKVTKAASLQTS